MKDLDTRLRHYSLYREAETLHEIRVDVKKVKAVLNLLNYSQKKFRGHRSFLPFRNIFRKAGAVREPEVLQQLLDGKPNRKVKTNKNINRAIEAFVEDIPFFLDTIQKQWKKLKPCLASVHRKDFNRFLRQKKREVELKLFPEPDMKEIHKTRKAIKTVLYLSKVKDDLSEADKTFYSEMEETIGKLHDKQLLLANLKKLNGQAEKRKVKRLASGCSRDERRIGELATEYYR